MPRVFHLVDLRLGEILAPSGQEMRSKNKILFAPNDEGGPVAEFLQMVLDVLDHGVAGNVRGHGDVLDEPQMSDAVRISVVRGQVP